ncbi:DsbA family protein [Reyranella sp.]|jgi:protein-disulfide isomerase|uniref:DsbA family protein n=1 Tax=Reyranella sp. TaxID=1929291 RepID=UPI002F94135B
MRVPLLLLCTVLIIAGGIVAGRATAPAFVNASSPVTTEGADQAAFGKSIHDYLVAHPEVLVEAMEALEHRQNSERDAAAQKAIRQYAKELTSDPDSPVSGNPNGDVTVVEFSDYQCPYCKRAFPAVKSVVAADGKVKLVHKDLPILGEASRIAALAALAANNQHKHDAFHDALMSFNGKLDRDRILEIASSVGIDVAQLQKDMEDPKLADILRRNAALAKALDVRGTPAFVVGNQFVPGAVDADTLKQLIEEARKG